MPCHVDPPSKREIAERKLNDFLDEIGEKSPKTEYLFLGSGKGRKLSVNEMSVVLCDYCKSHPVSGLSLELQIWWRDHQRDDARHLQEEQEVRKRAKLRAAALKKLTPAERKALGH